MAKNAVALSSTTNDLVPDWLKTYEGPVKNSTMETDDLIIPRVKLLQAISPELKSFNEAKEGVFWHNVLNQPLGSELEFIVAMARRSYILFAPRGDDRVILARSQDGKTWDQPHQDFEVKIKGYSKPIVWSTKGSVAESRLADFGSSMPGDPQSPPAATLVYEYLVYLPAHPDCSPAMISLSRSGIKRGKDLNTKIELRSTTVPQFAQLYKAVVTEEQSPEGTYNSWAFKSNGVANEADFGAALNLSKRFLASSFRAADDDLREEAAPRDAGGGESSAY